MLDFEAKYLQDQQKVKPYYDAAKAVESKADDLYNHITQLKANIMAVASGERAVVEAGGDLSKYIAMDARMRRDTAMSIQFLEKKDEYQEITAYLRRVRTRISKRRRLHSPRPQAETRGFP